MKDKKIYLKKKNLKNINDINFILSVINIKNHISIFEFIR